MKKNTLDNINILSPFSNIIPNFNNLNLKKEQNLGLLAPSESNFYKIHPLYGYSLRQKAAKTANFATIQKEYIQYYQKYAQALAQDIQQNPQAHRDLLSFEINNLIEVLFRLFPNGESIESVMYLITIYYKREENPTAQYAILTKMITQFEQLSTSNLRGQLLLDYVACQDNLATWHREKGAFTTAISIYQKSLKKWESQVKIKNTRPLFAVTKVLILTHLASTFRQNKQLSEGEKCMNIALPLAEKYANLSLKSTVYTEIGHLHKDSLAYDQSEASYQKALALARDDIAIRATVQFNLGAIADDLKQWEKSLNYYEKALTHFYEMGDVRMQATVYQNMGLVLEESGQPEKAIDYFKQAIPLFIEMEDSFQTAQLYQNLSIPSLNLYRFEESLDYLNKALGIYKSNQNLHLEAEVYQNMGEVLRRKGDYTRSLIMNEKALLLFQQLDITTSIGILHQNRGNIFLSLKEYAKAENQYLLAIQYFENKNDLQNMATVWHNMADLGRRKKDLELSKKYALKALEIYAQYRNYPKIGWLIANANLTTYALGKDKSLLIAMNEQLESHFSIAEMEKIMIFAKKYHQRFSE